MFETKTVVKLHDTDAAGIVFFANYFKIAHSAYEAFMKSIGCGLDHILGDSEYIILIAHAEADYSRPLTLGETVNIGMKIERIGESSFILRYEFDDRAGNHVAQVKTVHVAIAKKGSDKIPIPEKVRIGLQSLA